MLSNHAVALCLPNERRDLEHARDSLALTDTDIAEITSLPSQKGSYSTLYMISKRGRGAANEPSSWMDRIIHVFHFGTRVRSGGRERRPWQSLITHGTSGKWTELTASLLSSKHHAPDSSCLVVGDVQRSVGPLRQTRRPVRRRVRLHLSLGESVRELLETAGARGL